MNYKQISTSDISNDFIRDFNNLSSELSLKNIEYSLGDIESMLEENTFFGVFIQEKLIGFLVAIKMSLPQGRRCLLESFIISEKFQHKGYGTALLDFSLKQIKEEKIPHVNLTCNIKRKDAQSFYSKYGFEKIDTNLFRYYF